MSHLALVASLIAGFALAVIVAATLLVDNMRLRARFVPLLNADAEVKRLRAQVEALGHQRHQLSEEYRDGRTTMDRLRKEVSLLEENLEDISYGLYRPHFTYELSEEYKAAIAAVRQQQKMMVRAGAAAICPTKWTVGGSAREGERMTKQYQKLLIRAFNGEADAAIATVAWNNYRIMEERIRKAYEMLNKLGTATHVSLTGGYCNLKLNELRLVFEHHEKKRQELDMQRRRRAQAREEERVQRELARAQEEAAKDETRYERALDQARREAAAAVGAERDVFAKRVAELEEQLAEAHANGQRALAQAQMTKAGHVYIISNVGSFGQGVLKIGMTRRLEPEERIQELGDASVPFPFDLHALIYSDNAPDLEAAIHNHFWERRINLANDRKEFFRVPLEEVETFAKNRGLIAEFSRLAEAREFRETQAVLKAVATGTERSTVPVIDVYPVELFPAVHDESDTA